MSAVETPASSELTRDELLDAYPVMRTIREFEERVHLEFATGEIPGFVHLYAGEEAIAAAGTVTVMVANRIKRGEAGYDRSPPRRFKLFEIAPDRSRRGWSVESLRQGASSDREVVK